MSVALNLKRDFRLELLSTFRIYGELEMDQMCFSSLDGMSLCGSQLNIMVSMKNVPQSLQVKGLVARWQSN